MYVPTLRSERSSMSTEDVTRQEIANYIYPDSTTVPTNRVKAISYITTRCLGIQQVNTSPCAF